DEYFSQVPEEMREKLGVLRTTILQAAPGSTEVISYNMPAIKQQSVLVYYAACKDHIGFYPTGGPIVAFKDELATYKTSKGAIQLPLDKAIPKTLVKKIVQYRISEEKERAAKKK